MESFDQIELLFAALLPSGVSALSIEEQAEVQHFLDHGEYGLALETLVAIIAKKEKQPGDTAEDLVMRLSDMMEMDSAALLRGLRGERVP